MRHLVFAPALSLLTTALLAVGCANDVDGDAGQVMGGVGDIDASDEQAMTATCAAGPTVKGIDVSYYQSNIDWARVKADGVEFAFIRVSDGTGFSDPKFQRNWDGAKANGVRRGAYQFFRSNQNPEAQADLLADAIGQLEPGDLPPVIDVESTDGQSASTIRAKVQRWLDRVEARLGVRAIIYTGAYFWRDQAGGGDFAEYPLWIAHYGTLCPLVPPTWSQWTFHQHTSSGRVQGISGNVDMNVFNGTRAQLAGLAVGGSVQEPPPPPTSDECAPMEGAGSIIDDGSACFFAGGDPRWLKKVTNRGQGGDLISTGTTSSNRTENFAEWTLNFQEEGTYEIEAYIDDQLGTSRQARYRVTHADGTTDAVINQYASVGFVSLGAYHFRAGAGQKVRLNDNTGESSSLNRDLVFDAIRVTRLDDSTPPPAPDTCARLKVTGTNGTLNIRPQPNTQLAAIGTVDEGDVIDRLDTVTGQAIQGNTTWHKITDGTVTGFVTDVFVTCVP